ncbi:MAG TPA: hypothetical protein VG297_12455 [Bryobacteraceae bacterium]|nr:hypothetical protein [Bryobacteraceae bacterium]
MARALSPAAPAIMPALVGSAPYQILAGPLNVVDHKNVRRTAPGFKIQTERFPQSRLDRRRSVHRIIARRKILGPSHVDIECSVDARLVDDGPPQDHGHDSHNAPHADVRRVPVTAGNMIIAANIGYVTSLVLCCRTARGAQSVN